MALPAPRDLPEIRAVFDELRRCWRVQLPGNLEMTARDEYEVNALVARYAPYSALKFVNAQAQSVGSDRGRRPPGGASPGPRPAPDRRVDDPTRAQGDAFWARVDRSAGPDACWPWTGPVGPKGYGQSPTGRRGSRGAHRMAWTVSNGPIPAGLHVLHRCDNPPCCNPTHLWLGTNHDNVLDMRAKGREGHQNRPREVCRSGRHSLTEDNRIGSADGRRRCLACSREWQSGYVRRGRPAKAG